MALKVMIDQYWGTLCYEILFHQVFTSVSIIAAYLSYLKSQFRERSDNFCRNVNSIIQVPIYPPKVALKKNFISYHKLQTICNWFHELTHPDDDVDQYNFFGWKILVRKSFLRFLYPPYMALKLHHISGMVLNHRDKYLCYNSTLRQ